MGASLAIAVAGVSLVAGSYYSDHLPLRQHLFSSNGDSDRWGCRPFLPNLFSESPPPQTHPAIHDAVAEVDRIFASRFSQGDIDSLSVAVVTADGPLYEKNFGVTRGNETGSPSTTSHSMYRIALTGKLFIVLEGTASNWPHDIFGGGPPPTNGHPFPSNKALLDAIAQHHLTSPPWFHPAYSNTGTGLLGLALAAASSAAAGDAETISYADLVKRDIFEPMGLNGSHFLTTEENKHLVVVPSLAPVVADQDFLDAMNPAGGQFSSLSDLITVTQTLLHPRHRKSQLTPYTRDKWLRTVHAFEEDDWTELGFMWEIIKAEDSNGRLRKIYWKLGEMAGYHAAIAIHPGTSYGITVLVAGHYWDAAKLTYDAFGIFQPAIDKALSDLATELYAGEWRDDLDASKPSSALLVVESGTLYVERYTLLGVDALKKFGAQGRLALRPTGRRDEFRLDTGIPGYNEQKHMGCYPYWNGQDLWGVRNNAAINALYFRGEGKERRLHVPSLDLTMGKA
ncbi:beta-lactamase/transpeptidase-like protein [Pilatotrama ljubarskyi]|nr:beta-lactamase/transpeptidase-like protein [Pilatotrama ljubarskyi]